MDVQPHSTKNNVPLMLTLCVCVCVCVCAMQWFWEVVRGYDKKDLAILLQFATGW